MDPQIVYLLSCVADRFRRLRFAWLLTIGWLMVSVAVIMLGQFGTLPKLRVWYFVAMAATIIALWLGCKAAYRDRRWIANSIEKAFPSLKQRLVTAVQPAQASTSSFLSRALVEETIQL